MADEFSKPYVQDILDIAEDKILTAVKDFRDGMRGLPYGASRPSDEDFLVTWERWTAQYPVQPCILPNGTVLMESPWVLMLVGSENGREWLARYRTMVKRLPEEAV